MLEALDAEAIRRWSTASAASIDLHRREIDDLNVFPVPDRDTGTNLALTLRAAADALEASSAADAADALRVYARGAVLGARGNSGVILSQLLRGIAETADGARECDARLLREALIHGAVLARAAVAKPVDGTILTVASAAAAALRNEPASVAEVALAAAAAAAEALGHTHEQLPALTRAGVVDAGGRGLVLVLEALADTVGAALPHSAARPPSRHLPTASSAPGEPGFGFEVQYLLDAPEHAVQALRARLDELGDSVAIVGTGEDLWNVHVHVDDIGPAVEAGVDAGRPRDITVTRLRDRFGTEPDQHGSSAVVAITSGAALGQLFAKEGVYVVDAGEHGPPSVAELTRAGRAGGAAEVVLLPNAAETTEVAEAAAALLRSDGVRATVVPTRSPVQGLAAVAVHDPTRRFDDDVVSMAEAAAATRYAELSVAEQDALTSAGMCRAGDVLGLIDGEVVEIGHEQVAVALALTDRLLGIGAELMTVLVGAAAPGALAQLITEHVRDRAPLTELSLYRGGPADPLLIIGAE